MGFMMTREWWLPGFVTDVHHLDGTVDYQGMVDLDYKALNHSIATPRTG